MPRAKRDQRENTTYHIWTRCIEWRFLMKDDDFKGLFIQVIRETQEFYTFELTAYQIMDNHIHLIIKTLPDGTPISRIMQYLKARFAERYNRITGRFGPFWNERYRDSIVDDSENPVIYLIWLLWYLAYNPVRKGKVSNPRYYRYGSINYYLDEMHEPTLKIHHHDFFLRLGNDFKSRLKQLLYFEDAYRRRLSIIWSW